MTQRNVTHATFVIERDLAHPPAKVFAAYADLEKKKKWFGGPPEWEGKHTMDFRVGGKETSTGGPPGGVQHKMSGVYWDIVQNERIVMSYEMHLDAARISVSLGTTEIKPDGAGSKLIYTEQGAYLDGYDDAGQREEGSNAATTRHSAMAATASRCAKPAGTSCCRRSKTTSPREPEPWAS